MNDTVRKLPAADSAAASSASAKAQLTLEVNAEAATAQINAAARLLAAANSAFAALVDRAEKIAGALRVPGEARITGGKPRLLEDPKRGFPTFGHFAHAVIKKGRADDRLRIIASAPSTFGNEQAGADGGFAVPPQFSREIFTVILAGDSLMPLCEDQETEGNSMTYPIDEAPPWGSSGVIASWQVEGASLSQIKPALRAKTLRLHKLLTLVALTDELLGDASALESYLPVKVADAISWKFNQAILQGNGNGQPLGILGSNSAVVQAKDAGQLTNTLSVTNASNMLTRLPPGSHARAVYLCSIPALGAITSFGAAASGYGMTYGDTDYVPGTRIPSVGRLLGRPVVPTAHLPNFSSQGDLCLVDLSYYRLLTKSGGIDVDWSFDVWFDADACAFRASFRCDGQPLLAAPITPPFGATTLSPFIQLAAR